MRIYFAFIFLSTLFLFVTIVFAQNMKPEFFPYPVHQKILPNGLKVIVVPLENPGLVAYYSIVRTGSRDEYEPGHTGFAHFFEHIMFRGTKKYPGAAYDRLVTEMGANSNAYTSDDLTCFHLVHSKEHLDQVMELESDRFQNLFYDETAFKTEAGAVHGEYLKSLSSPWSILSEKLMETAFKVHTYRHTTIGFRQDIEAMPMMYDYSRSFFKRCYRPENVILLLTGDLNPEETFKKVEKYYGNWQPGYVSPEIEPEPEQKAEQIAAVTFTGKTLPILNIGYKGPAFDPKDREVAACYLLGALLFGQNSEIYKKLVVREQRVQFISASFLAHRDPNLLEVYSMIQKEDDIQNIRDEIYQTIEQAQQGQIAADKLEDLKQRLRYGFLMNLDTAENVADRLTRYIAITGTIESVDDFYLTCDRITTDELIAAARKYLVPEKRTTITLTGGAE